MKHIGTGILAILLCIIVLACPNPADSNGTTNSNGPVSDKYFWGHWTRMDTGEVYYISDRSVTIGEGNPVSIRSVTGTSLQFASTTIQV